MKFSYVFLFISIMLATYVPYVASRHIPGYPKNAHELVFKPDQQPVLDCVLKNRGAKDSSFCFQDVIKTHNDLSNIRMRMAMHYYHMLLDALSQIDRCLHLEEKMMPLPEECSYLDDVDLVEHCFLHHQVRVYKPCEGISYPRIAVAKDARTLFHYSLWYNITTEHHAQNKPKDWTDSRGIINHCMHCNTWRHEPDNVCHQIVTPDTRVSYSDLLKRMQLEYQQMLLVDRKRDCEYFHAEETKNGTGQCAFLHVHPDSNQTIPPPELWWKTY